MNTRLLNSQKKNPLKTTFAGIKNVGKLSSQAFSYDFSECIEISDFSISEFEDFRGNGKNNWINIDGIHEKEKIKAFCAKLNIHDLAIQNILDVNHIPKFQEFEDYYFFTLKSIVPVNGSNLQQEQLSFILGKNYLISFQEQKADYFELVRENIRKKIGKVRERGSDYLLYLLLDSILDNYFKTLDDIDNKIDESIVVDIDRDPSPEIIYSAEYFKRQINQIKKTILPIKEFVTKMEREQIDFVDKKQLKYFYELQDQCIMLMDECDQIVARLESNINLFFSVQGHRMNQIMKTLTVIATIFIPLTFITGVYGMNFINMPELQWKWGYFTAWSLMIIIFILMVIYFKRKKWY